jgi:hypothetical protein
MNVRYIEEEWPDFKKSIMKISKDAKVQFVPCEPTEHGCAHNARINNVQGIAEAI